MIWLSLLALLALLTWFYAAFTERRNMPVAQQIGANKLVLKRNRQGHYLAAGEINGREVVFLIDTGATDVALSQDLARKLGLDGGPTVEVQTANGVARGYMTRLDQVALGPIRLNDVRAIVVPNLGQESLLGMSFLRNLTLTQTGDEMTLSLPTG